MLRPQRLGVDPALIPTDAINGRVESVGRKERNFRGSAMLPDPQPPYVSQEFMDKFVEYVMQNTCGLTVANDKSLGQFFAEIVFLVDDEIERAVRVERNKLFTSSSSSN